MSDQTVRAIQSLLNKAYGIAADRNAVSVQVALVVPTEAGTYEVICERYDEPQ